MRHRRVAGVLAALCVAAGSLGVLAIGLLAPAKNGNGPSIASTRSGWPIADAFSAAGAVSWLADDPNTSALAGSVPGGGNTPTPPPSTPTSQPPPTSQPQPQPAPVAAPPTETFVAQNASGLPTPGEATGYGCAAAIDYLTAYAAPGFWLVCPGVARGHQAMTVCQSGASQCSAMRIIVIADPCPNAYMNEAANSWTLMGDSDAPLDPYGSCA